MGDGSFAAASGVAVGYRFSGQRGDVWIEIKDLQRLPASCSPVYPRRLCDGSWTRCLGERLLAGREHAGWRRSRSCDATNGLELGAAESAGPARAAPQRIRGGASRLPAIFRPQISKGTFDETTGRE